MKASASDLLARLPGPRTEKWPQGERFVEALSHCSVVVELYAPVGDDPQTPHTRDELYFVMAGSGEFVVAGQRSTFSAGDAFFVASGTEHRFENFTTGFTTWVVFFGPHGGEP